MASVLLTRRIPSSVLSQLSAQHTVDLYSGEGAIPRGELLARVRGKDALMCLLTDRVDQEIMDAAPTLKIIANIAVGYENVDLAAAAERGIVVTNTPDVLTEAVAEFTWALILGVARRVAEGDRVVRANAWGGWGLDFMLGTELRGKQLGVVGAGRIGRAVAAKAPAFGMRVAFANRVVVPGERMSLDELLVTSDVVSIHVPLTPETRHLIDKRALVRMKRTALLINTSRGPVVDEAALVWALGERLLAGAALDVYEHEPQVTPELRSFENVLLAPHIGSATRETRTAMAQLAVKNVLAVLAGDEPLTPVEMPDGN
jgi:glyoxylate reductase